MYHVRDLEGASLKNVEAVITFRCSLGDNSTCHLILLLQKHYCIVSDLFLTQRRIYHIYIISKRMGGENEVLCILLDGNYIWLCPV